ncbi:MAG: peptidoglycan-binding protein [Chloroflexi bacterium]|nr:MAG: peptidoglycan-binding protein [Chloroflexota bacterium]RLC96303.1 MAG: peptidoglycan-binding protein [Chloroflexota bacterium]
MSMLTKATITNCDTNEIVECMFNPKEYTFGKQNTWKSGLVMGGNVPKVEFGGGQAMTLQMELFFDTYESGEDVRKHTNKIWKLMMINPDTKDKGNKGRPPLCTFSWGDMWSFKAVITSLSQKFTMFTGDGKPVRSTLSVTFQQAEEEGKYPGQNPTTLSTPGYKTRRVKEGETIDWIAFDEYGDPALWRFLAETNDLDDPLRLEVGQMLAIPPAP